MPTITLTPRLNNLDAPLELMLQADAGSAVLTRTASRFEFQLGGEGTPFAGYLVKIAGRNLTYDDDGQPTSGAVGAMHILTPAGRKLIMFDDYAPFDRKLDFRTLHSHIFGAEGGPGPNGLAAWGFLMADVSTIYGSAGDDRALLPKVEGWGHTYRMGEGDDRVFGGGSLTPESFYGGSGTDTLSYAIDFPGDPFGAFRGVTFRLTHPGEGTVSADPTYRDTFADFERFEGSPFNDTFYGSSGNDTVAGLRGADTLWGGAGDQDRVSYAEDAAHGGTRGIWADLDERSMQSPGAGRITDGFGTIDIVRGFEQVFGTRFDDFFFGSQGNDYFAGGEGKDFYDGKDGFDTVDFSARFTDRTPGAVHIDMRLASRQVIDDGFGNTETLRGIERIIGGSGNDTLDGNRGNQVFEGGAGSDLMHGRGGQDTFVWRAPPAPGEVDRIGDFGTRGTPAQVDRIGLAITQFENMRNMLVLVNGTAPKDPIGTLLFDRTDQTLYWDSDGTGPADRQAIVILEGVRALTPMNFDLFF